MTDETSGPPRARRQPSPAALAGRQASTFVRDLNRQLGVWQASSIKLHTMAERSRLSGHVDPKIAAEVRSLLTALTAEAERFEKLAAEQPAQVAEHGRVRDTRRSFEMISGRLMRSLDLLGEHAGDE